MQIYHLDGIECHKMRRHPHETIDDTKCSTRAIRLASLLLNFEFKAPKGLENEFLPARRPKPIPAVNSKLPIDLVPTKYSEEYSTDKSRRPTEMDGK